MRRHLVGTARAALIAAQGRCAVETMCTSSSGHPFSQPSARRCAHRLYILYMRRYIVCLLLRGSLQPVAAATATGCRLPLDKGHGAWKERKERCGLWVAWGGDAKKRRLGLPTLWVCFVMGMLIWQNGRLCQGSWLGRQGLLRCASAGCTCRGGRCGWRCRS